MLTKFCYEAYKGNQLVTTSYITLDLSEKIKNVFELPELNKTIYDLIKSHTDCDEVIITDWEYIKEHKRRFLKAFLKKK